MTAIDVAKTLRAMSCKCVDALSAEDVALAKEMLSLVSWGLDSGDVCLKSAIDVLFAFDCLDRSVVCSLPQELLEEREALNATIRDLRIF